MRPSKPELPLAAQGGAERDDAESSELLAGLARVEGEALARLRRRYEAVGASSRSAEPVGVSVAALRELEAQLDEYVRFHDAVRASASWKLLQRARKLFGREW
ncbi:MAG: hypothetical protein KDB94_00025 [Acidobacteria bacterium]|nr:hypothetical protein [Acidobacteriota bacterium]